MKNLSVPNQFMAMIPKPASSLLPSQSIIELEKIEKSKFRSVKGGYSLICFLLWAIMFWLLFSLGFVLQTNPSTQTAVSLINHRITVAVPLRFLSCRVFFRCSLRCCCRRYVSDYGFLFLLHQLTPIGPKLKLRFRQFSSSALWFGDVIWIFDPGIIGFWNCNQSKWLVIWTADIQNEDRNCINFVVQIYKLSRGFSVSTTNQGEDFFNRFITKNGFRHSWNQTERKAESTFCTTTVIRKFWYHRDISEFFWKTSGFVMHCAIWRFNQEMLPTYTIRIRGRSNMKENNGFNNPLASKAYLRKASSNSLLLCIFLTIWRIYLAYVIVCFSKVLYTNSVISI